VTGFDRARDGAFADLLDAVADGDGYYLACENGHGYLPPRRVCPDCGDRDLHEKPLPETGEVVTYTVISVAAPSFSEDTPYVTAVADFGPVRVTGMFTDTDPGEVETGMTVDLTVDRRETTDDRVLAFEPA
jgi:uncharacterized OB-fold protein